MQIALTSPDNTRYEVPNFISKEAASVNAGNGEGCWVVTLRCSQQDFCCGKQGGVQEVKYLLEKIKISTGFTVFYGILTYILLDFYGT